MGKNKTINIVRVNDSVSFDIKIIGAKIRSIREKQGLSMEQLSEMIMISPATLIRIENNTSTYHKDKLYSPRIETIMKICYVLGVPLKEIL